MSALPKWLTQPPAPDEACVAAGVVVEEPLDLDISLPPPKRVVFTGGSNESDFDEDGREVFKGTAYTALL